MDLVITSAVPSFFALVMASIGLHEIGHLVPGKAFDVKTTEYFVGFGRTLWSRRKGETEYGVKAVPVGGYVRLVGMFPPAKDNPDQIRAYSTGPFRALADNARAAEWSTIQPEDEGRLFYQKPFWQKLIIMACGPAMNILLAFLILLGVAATYGVYRSQLTISRFRSALSLRMQPTRRARESRRPLPRRRAFNRGTSSWRSTESPCRRGTTFRA